MAFRIRWSADRGTIGGGYQQEETESMDYRPRPYLRPPGTATARSPKFPYTKGHAFVPICSPTPVRSVDQERMFESYPRSHQKISIALVRVGRLQRLSSPVWREIQRVDFDRLSAKALFAFLSCNGGAVLLFGDNATEYL